MYDFETVVNRKAMYAAKYANVKEDVLALNVADMEFLVAPEITQALHQCVDQFNPYGYQSLSDEYYNAVIAWMERRHAFLVRKEWICFSNGVVSALHRCVQRLTKKQAGVILFTPVYGPFYQAIIENERQCVECPLRNDHETYTIDFEDFENKCKDENNTMLLLCSPHNPIGKVFTKEELLRICEIAKKYHVLVVADEIHHDLILEGQHTSVGTIASILDQCVICTAPSKTFNLAGLSVSNIIIPNETLRKAYIGEDHVHVNPFSMQACIAAYNEAESWLEAVLEVLRQNAQRISAFLDENFPQFPHTHIEGTYLLWINMQALGLKNDELVQYLIDQCAWYVNGGTFFGELGDGYIRVNLALPPKELEKALQRFKAGLKDFIR